MFDAALPMPDFSPAWVEPCDIPGCVKALAHGGGCVDEDGAPVVVSGKSAEQLLSELEQYADHSVECGYGSLSVTLVVDYVQKLRASVAGADSAADEPSAQAASSARSARAQEIEQLLVALDWYANDSIGFEYSTLKNIIFEHVRKIREVLASEQSGERFADLSALVEHARSRVGERFKVVSHGELGEPSNGALLLRLADAVATLIGMPSPAEPDEVES